MELVSIVGEVLFRLYISAIRRHVFAEESWSSIVGEHSHQTTINIRRNISTKLASVYSTRFFPSYDVVDPLFQLLKRFNIGMLRTCYLFKQTKQIFHGEKKEEKDNAIIIFVLGKY